MRFQFGFLRSPGELCRQSDVLMDREQSLVCCLPSWWVHKRLKVSQGPLPMKHVNWNLLKLYCSNLQWIPNHEPRETCWLPCRSFKDAEFWSWTIEPCPEHWRYESAAIVAMYAWSQALFWSWTVYVLSTSFLSIWWICRIFLFLILFWWVVRSHWWTRFGRCLDTGFRIVLAEFALSWWRLISKSSNSGGVPSWRK